MPTPTYPSPPSMDAIPSEDGCWWSLSGFWLTVARQNCGERRGGLSTNTYAPEDTHWVSSGQFFRGHMDTEVSVTCSEQPKEVQRVFKTYWACFLTLLNAQEWPELRELLDLSLKELTESTFGDIFPKKSILAQSSAQHRTQINSSKLMNSRFAQGWCVTS